MSFPSASAFLVALSHEFMTNHLRLILVRCSREVQGWIREYIVEAGGNVLSWVTVGCINLICHDLGCCCSDIDFDFSRISLSLIRIVSDFLASSHRHHWWLSLWSALTETEGLWLAQLEVRSDFILLPTRSRTAKGIRQPMRHISFPHTRPEVFEEQKHQRTIKNCHFVFSSLSVRLRRAEFH